MYRANRVNILYYHRKAQHGDMLIKDTDCNYSTSVNYGRAPRWKEKKRDNAVEGIKGESCREVRAAEWESLRPKTTAQDESGQKC